jgi:hypothetical protein
MGWRTAEMLKVYDHAITRAEMKERMAHSVHEWVENAARDRTSLEALLRGGLAGPTQQASETHGPAAFVLTDSAREGLAWLEGLDDA